MTPFSALSWKSEPDPKGWTEKNFAETLGNAQQRPTFC
jgi:hypothetical protein